MEEIHKDNFNNSGWMQFKFASNRVAEGEN